MPTAQYKANSVFYNKGLRFTCKRCSSCCRYDPGYVFLSENDLSRLSTGLRFSRKQLIQKYCRIVNISGFKRLSLTEKENYDCVFWGELGCICYPYRPLQCSSFPFWRQNLHSSQAWERLKETCPGINTGEQHSYAEIRRFLEIRQEEPLIIIDENNEDEFL